MGTSHTPNLNSLRANLRNPDPWLAGPEARGFAAALAAARKKIRAARGRGARPAGPVVVAESAVAKFLAGVLAAVEAGVPVVLASPRWGEVERCQAAMQITPGWWLGEKSPRWPDGAAGKKFSAKKWPGAILIPTGGTGGRVRWAVHSWDSLAAAARGLAKFFDATGCTHVSTLPPWHVSGLMPAVRAIETAGMLWLEKWETLEAGTPPMVAAEDAIISLVPMQLERLLRHQAVAKWLRDTRAILLGGAAAPPGLLERARKLRLPVALAYGLTETAAVVAAQTPAQFLAGEPPGARPLPHAKVWIRDDAGKAMPAGKNGRIWIQADSLFEGYFPTRRKRDVFATEDGGVMDKHGRITPLRRFDRVIVTGGEKVDPTQVEREIHRTKLVTGVRVAGLPDPEWGERVMAIYTGRRRPEAELRAALRGKIAAHAIPKIWIHARRLPAGKVLRGK